MACSTPPRRSDDFRSQPFRYKWLFEGLSQSGYVVQSNLDPRSPKGCGVFRFAATEVGVLYSRGPLAHTRGSLRFLERKPSTDLKPARLRAVRVFGVAKALIVSARRQSKHTLRFRECLSRQAGGRPAVADVEGFKVEIQLLGFANRNNLADPRVRTVKRGLPNAIHRPERDS